ncbi:putative ABC transport system ATP-binding protein [Oceanotoga teriensis]|jgi:putative ABC transport system ATP-binding protein|uniref:ABC transport system ATP-binding protein n=1 Tax=Oceanotoga teriensis TaxID=515440 RepID=A0AA45HJ92_9BACT|nr:ATP-binding cassette domain-containing protein [Oceanotoga teriensis]PWJ95505.1 putative ABC transport system ATP-binding protein [Oceanotoga teriensis]
MVSLEKIKVIYDNGVISKTVLEDFNLNIKKGDFISVIGENGAGKTTFFKVLTGEIKPVSGNYILNGKVIKNKKSHFLFRKLGVVYQNPEIGVFPDLTIEENLILGSRKGNKHLMFRSLTGVEFLESLEIGLEKRLKTKVSNLSGGQKQMLSLVIASMTKPDILLLDEHTAALDPQNSKKVMDLTYKINQKYGITILMISHNLELLKKYPTRIVEIKDGKIFNDINSNINRNCLVV